MAAPSTNATFQIWQSRFIAIRQLVKLIQDRPESVTEANAIDRTTTIDNLLAALEAIGQLQFDFFHAGFTDGGTLTLEPDADVTPVHAMSRTLDQIANDVVVIQRAQEQRFTSLNSNRFLLTGLTPAEALAVTDIVAYMVLLTLGQHLQLNEKTTVLTYLHKATNVRVIPYAPVALIGIPVSLLNMQLGNDGTPGTARDLLAIPHEFAHHLYWNGKRTLNGDVRSLRSILVEKLQSQPVWVQNWAEEIFADVITCLVGGPLAALSFQDLLLKTRVTDLLHDNHRHPLPLFRPYIYTQTLRKMAGMQHAPNKLEDRWQYLLQGQKLLNLTGDPKQMVTLVPQGMGTPGASANSYWIIHPYAHIEAVVNIILEEVLPNTMIAAGMRPWSADFAQGDDLRDSNTVETFYTTFGETTVVGLIDEFEAQIPEGSTAQDLLNTDFTVPGWKTILADRETFADVDLKEEDVPDNFLERLEEILIASEVETPGEAASASMPELKLPPAIWRRILLFAGWTTEGPEAADDQ